MKTTKAKLWIAVAIVAGLCVAIRFTGPVDDHIRYAASSAAWSGNMLKLRMMRLLGVDIHKPVPGRGPLLVSAAWTGQQKVIAYLLAAGVDIETKDKFDGTALSRAAQEGHVETVRLLINAGANVNVQDLEGGNTPLDLCLMNCRRKGIDPAPIVALLTKAGGKAVTPKE
jgi:ankyrin repeat protein